MTRRHYNLPSLSALAAFEAVARNLNLTRAAEELNVTPGAVSKQIHALELELGHSLLNRHPKGVTLTAEGEAIASSLHEAFEKVSRTVQTVRESGERAHVSVATTMATMQLWLMPRLGSFWRAHQDIVVEHITSDRPHGVPRNDIDLHVRYGSGQWTGEEAMKIHDDRVIAVASPTFLQASAIPDLAALSSAPLLSVEGDNWIGMTWASFFREAGTPFNPVNIRRFNSYVIALQAARDGQGVALGWLQLVSPLLASGELVKVTEVEAPDSNSMYVTWNSRRPLRPAAVRLRDWLAAQGR